MAKKKYTQGNDGKYRTKVWDGTYNANGTKHRINLVSDKSSADLEKQVIKYKDKIANKQIIKKDDILFSDYANAWMETYKSGREENTRDMYRNIIDIHFLPLYNIRVTDLSHYNLQSIINNAIDKPRTCQMILLTFKQIIKKAEKDRIVPKGTLEELCDGIELPKYVRAEKRPLTSLEKESIFKADFTERERCFVYLIYGCGLRREEAIALTRKDINFNDCTLSISKALSFTSTGAILKTTKSKNGIRIIPMPVFLSDFLKMYSSPGINLICKIDGGTITKSSYDKMWASIIKKMNYAAGGNDAVKAIHGLTAHIFRHNYCTELCYKVPSISVKMIARLMGDTEKMVLDVYNHIVEDKEQTKEVIGEIFEDKKRTS